MVTVIKFKFKFYDSEFERGKSGAINILFHDIPLPRWQKIFKESSNLYVNMEVRVSDRGIHCSGDSLFPSRERDKNEAERVVAMEIGRFCDFPPPFAVEERLAPPQ